MSQLGHKNIGGDAAESIIKVQVSNIHCSPLIHKPTHFITEGSQVGQAWLILAQSIPVIPDHHHFLSIIFIAEDPVRHRSGSVDYRAVITSSLLRFLNFPISTSRRLVLFQHFKKIWSLTQGCGVCCVDCLGPSGSPSLLLPQLFIQQHFKSAHEDGLVHSGPWCCVFAVVVAI